MLYYLVNHTRKEFYSFDNKQSIFKILKESLAFPEWKDTDEIHVESEYLYDLEYRDLQACEGCIGCDAQIECGADGYCAPCWNERYGCDEN